jgi:hypothetical protein
MLLTDMAEKRTSAITIPDVSSECVESLLQFLYYGETDGLERKNVKQIQELIKVGDMYMITSLVDACVGVLMKKPYEVDFGLQDFLDLFTFAQNPKLENLEGKLVNAFNL